MRRGVLGVIISLLLACQGCVALPVPSLSRDELSGFSLKKTDFIKPGVTTRKEVLDRLGAPYEVFDDLNVYAYRSEKVAWYLPYAWGIGSEAGAVGDAGYYVMSSFRVYLILFDDKGLVERTVMKDLYDLLDNFTIRETAENWLNELGGPFALKRGREFEPSTDLFHALVYIYRESGWRGGIPVAVYIDDFLVAELNKNTYVTAILSAGMHRVHVDSLPSVAGRKQESLGWGSGAGHLGTTYDDYMNFDTPLGKTVYVGISVDILRKPSVHIMSAEVSREAMKDMKSVGYIYRKTDPSLLH